MASTPQSQARSRLRAVAREGARYVASLPVYEDAPYASLEAAAHHYRHEHRDGLYMEEYIAVDPARRAATLAVRWVSDGDTATGYQPPAGPDGPHAGYGDVTLDHVGGVAQRHRRAVACGIRAALALAAERDDLPWDPLAVAPAIWRAAREPSGGPEAYPTSTATHGETPPMTQPLLTEIYTDDGRGLVAWPTTDLRRAVALLGDLGDDALTRTITAIRAGCKGCEGPVAWHPLPNPTAAITGALGCAHEALTAAHVPAVVSLGECVLTLRDGGDTVLSIGAPPDGRPAPAFTPVSVQTPLGLTWASVPRLAGVAEEAANAWLLRGASVDRARTAPQQTVEEQP